MAATARYRSPQRDRRPIPAALEEGWATSPGPASTPPTSCGPRWPQDLYPTTIPPQPSGGAPRSATPATAERARHNPQRRASDQAHDAPRDQQPSGRDRHHLRRLARAVEPRPSRRATTPEKCFGRECCRNTLLYVSRPDLRPGAARVLAALRAAPQSGATITPF